MDLPSIFTRYFGSAPVNDPEDEDFLVYTVSEEKLTLKVSVHSTEPLVFVGIWTPASEIPVLGTLQREVTEAIIKNTADGRTFLWFKSATNAVFINREPISVQLKG